MTWRVGRSLGRTLYDGQGRFLGIMETSKLAAQVVALVNGPGGTWRARVKDEPPSDERCEVCDRPEATPAQWAALDVLATPDAPAGIKTEEWCWGTNTVACERLAKDWRHEALEARDELELCDHLLAVQRSRMHPADVAWREAHGEGEHVYPDLGVLIEWLMAERDEAKLAVALAERTADQVEAAAAEAKRLVVRLERMEAVEKARVEASIGRASFARSMDDPLHPGGRCTCFGEGACDWCKRTEAKLP